MIFAWLNLWRTCFSVSPSMYINPFMFPICPGVILSELSSSLRSNSLGVFDKQFRDCFRYWYVVEQLDGGESPTDALLEDWQLLLTTAAWTATCVWALWPKGWYIVHEKLPTTTRRYLFLTCCYDPLRQWCTVKLFWWFRQAVRQVSWLGYGLNSCGHISLLARYVPCQQEL